MHLLMYNIVDIRFPNVCLNHIFVEPCDSSWEVHYYQRTPQTRMENTLRVFKVLPKDLLLTLDVQGVKL